MKTITSKKGSQSGGRRGFVRNIGVATAGAIVSVAVPAAAVAAPALTVTEAPQAPAALKVSRQELLLLRNFRKISNVAQHVIVDMCEEMAVRLPRVATTDVGGVAA